LKLREILQQEADVGICDGVGVSLASKILYNRFLARCTGCDLFFKLISAAERQGWKVFMLGATAESNRLACEKLQDKYPDLQIVGRQDGYFNGSSAIVDRINDSGADMLFAAMGSPKQEYWLADHRHELDATFCMGVGGSFNVAAGTARRAPKIFQRMGAEFLYQLITEPKRIKRQIVYVPYVLKVLGEKFRKSPRKVPIVDETESDGTYVSEGEERYVAHK